MTLYSYESVFDQDYLTDDALIEDIWEQNELPESYSGFSEKMKITSGEKRNDYDEQGVLLSSKKKGEGDALKYPETSKENLKESHQQYPLEIDKNNITNHPTKILETKASQKNVKLYNDLPSAKQEALKTFEEHFYNIYHSRDLGESGQEEIMTCECKSEWDGTKNQACDKNSDCINRMTSVECTDDCNCGEDCQNRRFKLRQYSNIDVIKTKKKGYGIRANSDLESGQFVYEYVGEVIDEKKFRKRMKIYADEDIKHFYFMMLQRGEYIDATRKGGLARFLNHSCSPNCYVDKWVVGTKLRMGIFCKRNILKGEELTFDYNVDRYGTTAQSCYCEEPGCIGVIGGKTQTESHSKISQSILEALGFEDLDFWDLSSTKKIRKKKKGETDEEYYSSLQSNPIDENGVTKIMSALLQCKERWIINRLLLRIHSNNDPVIQRRVMKMHGYQILGSVLRDWKDDFDISNMILNILLKWPRITKNKISSSKIETTVQTLSSHENAELRRMAQELIREWGNLSIAYRIPKKPKTQPIETVCSEAEDVDSDSRSYQSPSSQNSPVSNEQYSRFSKSKNYDNYRTNKGAFRGERFWRPEVRFSDDPDMRGSKPRSQRIIEGNASVLPPGWAVAKTHDGKPYYYCGDKVQWEFPLETVPPPPPPPPPPPSLSSFNNDSLDLQKIIDEANAELMERQNNISKHTSKNNKNNINKDKDYKHSSSKSEKEKLPLEKILIKTFAKYVPNVIAKFQDELGKDEFKKRAKEIVEILVKKEMRPGHEIRNIYELSSTKKKKIKEFSQTYIEKVINRKKEKNQRKTTKLLHKQGDTNGFVE